MKKYIGELAVALLELGILAAFVLNWAIWGDHFTFVLRGAIN